jgi:carbon monoxide dehydrogenase subunit G
MHMAGEQRIAASRARVWEALNDPEVLKQCIPGCQSLDREGEDRLNAVAEVKIGPIGARFKGTVTLSDLDPPNGYTISGQGNGGVAGNAKGGAKVRLSDDGAGTLISYDVEAEVGGRMAQLGGPLIDATAKQMAGRFFAKFGEVVGAEAAAAEAPAAAPAQAVESPAAALAAAPAAAPATVVVQAPAAAPVPGGAPWSWIVVACIAIVAGFLLGRSSAADWWVVAMVILVLAAAAAGYSAGRSGGRS